METTFETGYGVMTARITSASHRDGVDVFIKGNIKPPNCTAELICHMHLSRNHVGMWIDNRRCNSYEEKPDMSRIVGQASLIYADKSTPSFKTKATIIENIYNWWVAFIKTKPEIIDQTKIDEIVRNLEYIQDKLNYARNRGSTELEVESELAEMYKTLHELGYTGKYSNKPFWKIHIVCWTDRDPKEMTRDEIVNAICSGEMLVVPNKDRIMMVPDSCLDYDLDWDDKVAFPDPDDDTPESD